MTPPRIRLGGGGILSRDRPFPLPNNNPGPSMHRRSVQLDGERLQGRVHAHLDGLVQEQEAEYRNLDLSGRLRNAMGRLGDVFGALGWGIGGGDEAAGDAGAVEGWGPPRLGLGAGGARGRARGWGRGAGGWRGRGQLEPFEPPEEEEQPLNLPEAPEWKASFTHPGKMRHGFTSDFAPIEPELIVLEDSDEEIKSKKGKGKAKQPIRNLDSETGTGQTLMLVCTRCKDPLLLGGETDEERVYGLRCGHVIDGKCLWNLAKPSEPQPHPSNAQKVDKGKDRAEVQEAQTTMAIDPSYPFTFVPPVENLGSATTAVYQEDNHPNAAPVRSRAPLRRSGGQARRGIVPIPNASARHTRRRTRQNALDGVHDELTPDPTQEASTSTPRLELSDSFFPSLAITPQRGRGGARGARGSGARGNGGRTKMRKVPKTKGRLREEVFEWKCPVAGCGREHISVRLDMEGAKWKCDPDKGAVLMFL
jgi:hypothetical protein